VAIKNGQSIETDNCIATFIYILSFTVTIFMYQAQLINTEILSDKIKRNSKEDHTYVTVEIYQRVIAIRKSKKDR
jgi:hypothetical protein